MGNSRENKKPYEIPEKRPVSSPQSFTDEPEYDSYPDISNAVSYSECTGLMYAPPQNDDELRAYQELSSMEFPKIKGEKHE